MFKLKTLAPILPLVVMGCKQKDPKMDSESLSSNGGASNQVTVHVVYNVNEELDNSLRKQGIKICVGQITWSDQKDRFNEFNQKNNNYVGVWLGSLGCYPGNGYKLAGSGAFGENVVTPLWWRSHGMLMGMHGGIMQRDVGTFSFDLLGASSSKGQMNELCTGKYATYCKVDARNKTLVIQPR